MEKELKETMNETVSKLKTAIEQETELELAKLRADKSRELETLKKEFKNNLEKVSRSYMYTCMHVLHMYDMYMYMCL